jgi:hypothetical protein
MAAFLVFYIEYMYIYIYIHHFVLNTEKSGPDLGIAGGDPDLRTPFLSLI